MHDRTDVENEQNISVAGSLDVALIFIHSQLEKSLGNTELACGFCRYTGWTESSLIDRHFLSEKPTNRDTFYNAIT